MSFKNLGNVLNLGFGILFLGFSMFLTLKIFQNTSNNFTLTFIPLIIFYGLSYLFLANALIRIQYRKSEQGMTVSINDDKKSITLKNNENGDVTVINNESVKAVELYYSWNTNPFSSDLGYSKIILNNKPNIFITQSKISQSEIKSLFKKKVIKEKSRFMNRLR